MTFYDAIQRLYFLEVRAENPWMQRAAYYAGPSWERIADRIPVTIHCEVDHGDANEVLAQLQAITQVVRARFLPEDVLSELQTYHVSGMANCLGRLPPEALANLQVALDSVANDKPLAEYHNRDDERRIADLERRLLRYEHPSPKQMLDCLARGPFDRAPHYDHELLMVTQLARDGGSTWDYAVGLFPWLRDIQWDYDSPSMFGPSLGPTRGGT